MVYMTMGTTGSGISRKEAQQYIIIILRNIGVMDYIRETPKASIQGYVATIMNRRRYLPILQQK